MVEVSYAEDGTYLYQRAYDRSDRTVSYCRVAWTNLDIDYDPWNGTPRVPSGLWEPCDEPAPDDR